MILGYARVSTADQDLAAQLDTLTAAGAERVFREKISGARSDRPELAALLRNLQAGDILLVTRIDRLARSTLDLLSILKTVGDIGASFKSLGDAWADFTTPHGRLILTVMGAMAEWERELIKARTGEGRKRAKAEGRKCGGPKPKMTPEQKQIAISRLEMGDSYALVSKYFGVSIRTIKRLAQATPPEPCIPADPAPVPSLPAIA